MNPPHELLGRLFGRLEEAARREFPDRDRPEVTVGDVYQRLIPYRAIRGELGILELAEYEHALLRLLAGEGGHLVLESDRARAELDRELASPSPILGVYRDLADVPVRFAVRAPAADDPADAESAGEAERTSLPPLAAAEPPATLPAACVRCAAPLPAIADLRFCPSCGADQTEPPCAGCGQPLGEGWRFCARCGTPRDPGAVG